MREHAAAGARFALRDALAVGWLGALLATLGHAAYVIVRVFGQHKFSWTSRDILWTGPLSYGLYLIPVALLAYMCVRGRSVTTRARTTLVAALALAGFAVLLQARMFHPAALLALSAGVAYQVAGWVASRVETRLRLVRRATLVLTAGCLIGALAIRGLPLIAEARALASSDRASAEKPNVLVVILDTVRAASMGLYGYSVPNTPRLERLASEGTNFTWAFSNASWSLPSHASILTGLDAKAVDAGWKKALGDERYTLGEHLAGLGFVQAGFIANTTYATWETNLHQGFHRWEDIVPTPREIFWTSTLSQTTLVRDLLNADSVVSRWKTLGRFNLRLTSESRHVRVTATSVVDRMLDWQARVGDRRFFAVLNLFDAHDPYEAPEPWRTKFVATPSGKDQYEAAIAYMDHELGRLVDELAGRGVLDHTIVVVTSDHGELFGEHDLRLHGQFLYLNSIHVPLVIRFPGKVPAGRVVDVPVSLERLAPTITALAGDSTQKIPGRSLASTWSGAPSSADGFALSWVERFPWGDNFPASKGPIVSVVDSTWHWLLNADGREELYRYREDRVEARDHAQDAETAEARQAFRAVAAQHGLISEPGR